MKSRHTTQMEFYTALIESNFTKEAVQMRRQWVRKILTAYKDGTIKEAHKRFLIMHIQAFMSYSKSELEERCAQILCLFYLSPHPPTSKQLAEQYHIDRTTVFNNINAAINDLTVVIFGVEGIEMSLNSCICELEKYIENNTGIVDEIAMQIESHDIGNIIENLPL